MFLKNSKKKAHPILVIGVGAMAVYGAYSMVHMMRDKCTESCKMITKAFKKKEKCEDCSETEEC